MKYSKKTYSAIAFIHHSNYKKIDVLFDLSQKEITNFYTTNIKKRQFEIEQSFNSRI